MSGRVLPDVSHPDFAPFWEGCARRQLVVPQCANGHLIWPPRPTCPRCVEPVATWTEVRGAGRLYSWTVVHRTRLAWYADHTPYVVGIVTINHEQPLRMVGRCEIALEDLCDGVDMVIDFEDATRHVTMPFWRRPAPDCAEGARRGR